MTQQIISEAYREQNRELHQTNEEYGVSGATYRNLIRPLAKFGRLPILDFGCGKQTLSKSLGPAYFVTDYDPCIAGLDNPPSPHPVVACTDVLEHIEPDFLGAVLAELRRLTLEVAFVAVAMLPSTKTLPDGRNSHLIVEPAAWWERKLTEVGFEVTAKKPEDRVVAMMWWIFK